MSSISRLVPSINRLVPYIPRLVPSIPRLVPSIPRLVLYISRLVPSIPRLVASTHRLVPSIHGLVPYIPMLVSSITRLVPSMPRQVPSIPRLVPSIPRLVPSIPRLVPSIHRLVPSIPRLVPSNPKLVPSIPRLVPSIPRLVPSIPRILPSIPRLVPSIHRLLPWLWRNYTLRSTGSNAGCQLSRCLTHGAQPSQSTKWHVANQGGQILSQPTHWKVVRHYRTATHNLTMIRIPAIHSPLKSDVDDVNVFVNHSPNKTATTLPAPARTLNRPSGLPYDKQSMPIRPVILNHGAWWSRSNGPSNQSTGRSNKPVLVGCKQSPVAGQHHSKASKSSTSFTEKVVYCVDNVSSLTSEDDVTNFVSGLDVLFWSEE